MKKIPIFFAFNNDYTVPAAVAFWSLLNRAKAGIYYEIQVLHHDISKENKVLLKSVVNRFKNASVHFCNTGRFMLNEFKTHAFLGGWAGSKFTADTVIRCFAARFFPQYQKIIYSDVDVVFMDDISSLYDIDLKQNYIAGVRGPFSKYQPEELSHLKPKYYDLLKNCYVGGGIWLMNLNQIRQDNLEQRMLDIASDDSIVKRFPDQDIMNIACAGRVFFLPLNYISYPYLRQLMRQEDFQSNYSREELFDSIINPKILHYAASKPWNNQPNHAEIWWNIYDYLELPRTAIFTKIVTPWERKIKKYKRLFNTTLLITIVLLFLLFYSIFLNDVK